MPYARTGLEERGGRERLVPPRRFLYRGGRIEEGEGGVLFLLLLLSLLVDGCNSYAEGEEEGGGGSRGGTEGGRVTCQKNWRRRNLPLLFPSTTIVAQV